MGVASSLSTTGPLVFGIPLVFLLFGVVLAGVIVLHKRALEVALVGLVLVLAVRLAPTSWKIPSGWSGQSAQPHITNVLCIRPPSSGAGAQFPGLTQHARRRNLSPRG